MKARKMTFLYLALCEFTMIWPVIMTFDSATGNGTCTNATVCQNNATCTVVNGNDTCKCEKGFAGKFCEKGEYRKNICYHTLLKLVRKSLYLPMLEICWKHSSLQIISIIAYSLSTANSHVVHNIWDDAYRFNFSIWQNFEPFFSNTDYKKNI